MIVGMVGVVVLIISTIWLLKKGILSSNLIELSPIVAIVIVSSYFDIHTYILSGIARDAISYLYQLTFPLIAILSCLFARKSIAFSIFTMLFNIAIIHSCENDEIIDLLKPFVIMFESVGILAVIVLSIKMLKNIREVSEINLLYFLLATFFLLNTIAVSVWNKTFTFELSVWINFMWVFLVYLLLIRLVLITILINAIRS